MRSLLVKYFWGKEWMSVSGDCIDLLTSDSDVEWIVDAETNELIYMKGTE